MRHLIPLTVLAGVLVTTSAQAATSHWIVTATGTGNWSDSSRWDVLPSSIGDADIIVDETTSVSKMIVDSGWATSGSINSLTYAASTGSYTQTLDFGTGVTSLTIGAGGITVNRTKGNVVLGSSATQQLVIGASQSWWLAATDWNSSNLAIYTSLAGSGNLTLAGKGAYYQFVTGDSTAYSGTMTLRSSTLKLAGNTQVGRLGSHFIFGSGTTNEANPNLVIDSLTGANQQLSMATNIEFATTSATVAAGARTLSINYRTTGASSLAFAGVWSGNLDVPLQLSSVGLSTGLASEDLVLRIQGDNSSLTSTKTGGATGSSAIYARTAVISVENQNALGSGNTLSISLGNGQGNTIETSRSSLFAKSGLTVRSSIYLNQTYYASANAAKSNVTKLGIQEAGAALFTGTITLQPSNYNATAQVNNRPANVHLTSVVGGTASFTGNIIDGSVSTGNWYAPVTAEGGGVVSVSGSNSYRGSTSVIDSTTLLANNTKGSATGSGSVRVGYGAASVSGDTTNGSSIITGIADTSKLVVGQTITGTGIPAGSIITFIHPSIAGRIEISQNATATNTGVSLSAEAETGILGGTGIIVPGTIDSVSQTIRVANGSSIAPGDVGAIGSLILDGTSTSASLLTMDAGAKFTFNLGTANTSDQLIFWNFTAGDLATTGDLILNNNVVELTDIQAGSYILMSFFSDGGTTGVNNSLISGLVDHLTLSGIDTASYSAQLSTSDNTLILTIAAVPEPSTWAMIVGGVGLLAFGQRLRRRSC